MILNHMKKKETKKINKAGGEPQVDEELKAIAQELNEFMQERKVALQPYMRPVISNLGFKTGEMAAVELVRYERE
jgi:hypothetical protein